VIEVKQTESDNCVQASVASLLELPLSKVPRFKPDTWYAELCKFVKKVGYGCLNVVADPEQLPVGYSLGQVKAGPSWPSDYTHCVVCKDGYVVYDPYDGVQPGTEQSLGLEYVIIYPLNPAAKD
jgi:hypothetical protein